MRKGAVENRHTQHFLDYIHVDVAAVMYAGSIDLSCVPSKDVQRGLRGIVPSRKWGGGGGGGQRSDCEVCVLIRWIPALDNDSGMMGEGYMTGQ